jgi:hypothetical protein
VDVSRASAELGAGYTAGDGLELTAIARVEHTRTRGELDRFLSTVDGLYGDGDFTAVGFGGRVAFDPTSGSLVTPHRFRLSVEGMVYPRALDAERAFGRAGASVSALLASSRAPAVALALRGGAEHVFGRAPWHHGAFIGGTETVRGWNEQRFAGDASVFGSAEVRARVLSPRVVVPAALGVFGFADAGRVFIDDGAADGSDGGWHAGVGGGLFLQPAGQPFLVRFGAASSAEATKVFLTFGLPY